MFLQINVDKKNAGEKIVFVKLGNKKDKQLKSEIKKNE